MSPIASFFPSLDRDRHLFDVSRRSRVEWGRGEAGTGRGGRGED